MSIAETIKAIRRELQMTQTNFAEAVHVSFSTVNRWENNRVAPNRMARALILDLCEKKDVNRSLIDKIRSYI
ncbi:helix-turn-helix domain-containing protein [Dehalobacterium formicoaceticum]|uniref:Helix-turn-helix domain-containing protein n=1 Tax=Dehalobacterium formicoaceticum TaxID=51515 RepID=A0ABT1Y069_9FIRM|nr:helix-turn-helix domain-containing protein [Dehalobacterium formicoaceticum]MCR6544262.1 helix-turn-helix domain-containing protein [Dehalobacterium formicoaceticum]